MSGLSYPKGKEIFVYPQPFTWDNLELAGTGRPISISGTRATGPLLFYDNREDYDKDFPNMEPVVLYVQGELGA